MPDIAERVAAVAERTVATRRDLHAHPEIAFQETRTAGIVAERLHELGLKPRTGPGGTGVVAVFDSGRPGRTLLLRADMDALPVPDTKSVPYRSQVEGANHACGHDGHTAVLLSVAEVLLAERGRLTGQLVFLFQPAEEIVRGAEAMLADGALDGLNVDACLALHLNADEDTGTVALRAGPAMAAADTWTITVKGRGGHAASPHQTVDPIVIGSQIVAALQPLVSRETDPLDQAVLSVTKFHAGTALNIVPETAELAGTLRTFDAETRSRLRERIAATARGVAAALQAEAEVVFTDGSPPVVNDPVATERVRRVAERIVGPERVTEKPPIMGGDDMALFLQRAPGCYFFVGSRGGEASGWPHHHPNFDLDEAALPLAVRLLTEAALDALQAD